MLRKIGRPTRETFFSLSEEMGARIRFLRTRKGLSQVYLARFLHISVQQVTKYETGLDRVPSTRIIDLCRVLDITPNILFNFEGVAKSIPTIDPKILSIAALMEHLKIHERRAVAILIKELVGG